jgi:hypothetical protein
MQSGEDKWEVAGFAGMSIELLSALMVTTIPTINRMSARRFLRAAREG